MNLSWLMNRLSGAIALGSAMALAGLIILLFAQRIHIKTEAEAKAAMQERQNMQARLTQVRQEKLEITDRLEEYKRLLQRGVIGKEKRLDWIDALVVTKEENKLPDLKYSIDPQKRLGYPQISATAEVETMTSPMKLDMTLVHEGDLFRVLLGLRRALPAHFLVEDCSIQRPVSPGANARLNATCKANVVTIRERDTGDAR
jgi:hypothetical protein